MDIITLQFFIAAICSIFIFYFLNYKFRILFLTFLSCAFIASLNYYLLLYVIVYSFLNYFIGLQIPGSKLKITLFRVGLLINLSQLVTLRYASFAIDPFFHIFNIKLNSSALAELIYPIGISYFTLQGIGYLINIKMGWEKPERNFLKILLFITFYPKYLSGPVERSNHFLPQIVSSQVFNHKQVTDGLRIALFGVFKKVAIANQLAPFLNHSYANLNSTDGSSLWFLFVLQPLYLYFDFSGYTDIAIGLAKTYGIDLLPNFNRPFFSENVTTFWKRFHISLSSWFNDYIFRQVSYKRRKWGIYASTYAVFLTFTLFGIWHGAGWNFMILGLLQAAAINFEFFTKGYRLRLFSKVPTFFRIWTGRLMTYLFYCGSLVFFFSPDLDSALDFFARLLMIRGSIPAAILNSVPIQSLVFIMLFLFLELIENDFKNISDILNSTWFSPNKCIKVFRWIIYYYALLTIFVLGNQAQQFIYFKF